MTLEEAIDAVLEDRADETVFAELDRLLRDDPQAQQEYLRRVDQHFSLKWQIAGEATYRSMAAIRERSRPRRSALLPRWVSVAAAAAALLAALLVFATRPPTPAAPGSQVPPVAVLMRTHDARWTGTPPVPGHALPAGRLSLAGGSAEIEFVSGARVLLQAPVELEMAEPSRAALVRGSVTVDVPPATGFRLDGPDIEVRSTGAEFGLRVEGDVKLSVFEGEVESRITSRALSVPHTLTLTREESLHLDEGGTLTANIVGAPGAFARLDEQADPETPRVANGSFEYPRTGTYPQLAAAGWRLEVHPLANLENMPVETGAGVIEAHRTGSLFTGPVPTAPEGRQWGYLNARTFPDGRTYHTSMHQAVGRLVPGAAYRLTAVVGRPEGGSTTAKGCYMIGLYAGTRESGPTSALVTWNDPELPAPGRTATLDRTFRVPADHAGDRTLYLRIASVPGTKPGTRQILLDDIRLERTP